MASNLSSRPTVAEFQEAKGDPAICLFPGLFTSQLKTDVGESTSLEYKFGNELLRVTMFERLGAVDIRVLQGLISIAAGGGLHGAQVSPDTDSERGLEILDCLSPERTAETTDSVVTAKFLLYQLARVIGLSDKPSSIETIKKSLLRLYETTLFWISLNEAGKQIGAPRRSFIISRFNLDKKLDSGQYEIGLNARISKAITGGRYTLIDMNEVRALRSDPARLIHQRLCGFINPGATHPCPIAISTLAGYAWHTSEEISSCAYRQRKVRVRKALAELTGLGWGIEEHSLDRVKIGRPKLRCDRSDGAL